MSNSVPPTNNWHQLINGIFNHCIPEDDEEVLIVSGPIYSYQHSSKDISKNSNMYFDRDYPSLYLYTSEIKYNTQYERRIKKTVDAPIMFYTVVFKNSPNEEPLIVAFVSLNRNPKKWNMEPIQEAICQIPQEGLLVEYGACETTLDTIMKIAAYPSENAFGFIHEIFLDEINKKNSIMSVDPPLKQSTWKQLKKNAMKMVVRLKSRFF